MKKIFLLSLLILGNFAWGQIYDSNNVTKTEAIQIVSRIKAGMREEDVSMLLATNKLKNAIDVGAIVGWDRCYGLSDGSSLHLSYTAREIAKDGHGRGNGLLQKAFIQSNGVNIVFITLTNAP